MAIRMRGEVAELLGLKAKSVSRQALKHNLKRTYKDNGKGRGARVAMIDGDALEFLKSISVKNKPKKEKPVKVTKKREFVISPRYWKVSVYDPLIKKMIVKHCSLSKSEAVIIASSYIGKGLISRASLH